MLAALVLAVASNRLTQKRWKPETVTSSNGAALMQQAAPLIELYGDDQKAAGLAAAKSIERQAHSPGESGDQSNAVNPSAQPHLQAGPNSSVAKVRAKTEAADSPDGESAQRAQMTEAAVTLIDRHHDF